MRGRLNQEAGVAQIERGFSRRTHRGRVQSGEGSRRDAKVKPLGGHVMARIETVVPGSSLQRRRGGRGLKAARTVGGSILARPAGAIRRALAGRRRPGDIRGRPGRPRRLAAAADGDAAIRGRHRRAGRRRTTRTQQRPHDRHQGDPRETRLGEGMRHDSFPKTAHALAIVKMRMIHTRRSAFRRQVASQAFRRAPHFPTVAGQGGRRWSWSRPGGRFRSRPGRRRHEGRWTRSGDGSRGTDSFRAGIVARMEGRRGMGERRGTGDETWSVWGRWPSWGSG